MMYPLVYAFAFLIMTLLGPLRFRARRQVPRSGGLLILSNHRADIDPIAIQLACPRYVHFMAKSELFGIPILGAMMRYFQAFPVKRGEPDRGAIRRAVALLRAGETVCVFPEGQLTETGKVQDILPGAALIVRMASAPVICCGIRNTEKIMPYGKVIPRPAFSWVTVQWGAPLRFQEDVSTEEIVDWIGAELRSLSGETSSSSQRT